MIEAVETPIEEVRPSQSESKTCTKCGEQKSLEEFSRSAKGLLGRRGDCKDCHAGHKAATRLANLEDHRARGRAKYWADPAAAKAATNRWREQNRESVRLSELAYKEANRQQIREKDRSRIAKDRAAHNERSRRSRLTDPEKHKERVRRWIRENPDKVREYHLRARSTPRGKIINSMRAALHRRIRKGSKGGQHTFDILGYSVAELMAHLERQFLPGMTWENYGEWHIDHRVPLASFSFETVNDADFKSAWSLSNLQPLWALDNLQKQARRNLLL